MKKLWLITAVILAAFTLLTGGTDATDINRMVFVSGIGIDRSGNGYSYTFHAAVPTGSDTAVSENNVEYESITLQADSLAQAVRTLEQSSSRSISLEHLNCCALGESVLADDITAMLDFLLRDPGVRRQCALLALEGSAGDFFGAEYSGSIASSAAALLEQQDDSSSRRSLMTLGRLDGVIESGKGFCLHILGLAGGDSAVSGADVNTPAQLELRGLAVFDAEGLSGRLDAQQAELARLFTSGQASGVLTAADEHGRRYIYEIRSSVCRREFIPGIPPVGRLRITAECMLIDSGDAPGTCPTDEQLSRSLHEQLSALLELSRSVGSAFTGLETEAAQSERLWYAANRGRWTEIYRSALLELDVKCRTADGK